MCEQAFGEGLHPWEFYEYTLEEYLLRKDGLFVKRKRELKEQFSHIQVLAYNSILPHLKPSERRKSIDQIIPNIYDEKPTKVISLKDRYQEIMKKYREAGILKDNNGSQ